MPRKQTSASAEGPILSPRHSYQWTVALYLILLSTFIVVLLTVLANLITNRYIERNTLYHLDALVMAKQNIVETRLQHDIISTKLLAADPRMVGLAPSDATALSETLQTLVTELVNKNIPVIGATVLSSQAEPVASFGTQLHSTNAALDRIISPTVSEAGWMGYSVSVPLDLADGTQNKLILHYSSESMLQQLVDLELPGGEVVIGRVADAEVTLLVHQYVADAAGPLYVGTLAELTEQNSPVARAIGRLEGAKRAEDYRGIDAFSAYRYLPTFGWGLVVKQDAKSALANVRAMTATLSIVSSLLILLSVLTSILISRHVTKPLRRLSTHVTRIGPGHWKYRRMLQTGDEVEILDSVIADLTKRLKKVYDNLESEVQKRTAELRDQYQKDRTILESIQQGMVVVDRKGIVTDANPAAQKAINADIIGLPIAQALSLHRANKLVPAAQHPVLKCLKTRKPNRSTVDVHWSLLQRDTEVLVPVILGATPIMKGKRLIGAVTVFYDVTEERRVDYLKSEFISLASHQLRTPLSTMQWYIELLTSEGETPLSTGQAEYISEMDTATKRMIRLVDALLQATRLENREVKPNSQIVDITTFAQDLGSEITALAKEYKISCTKDIAKKAYQTKTDPILLHIVFQNLFSNAVKYTPAGGNIDFNFRTTKSYYEFSVQDSGVGIPKKDQKRIFNKLFRANNVQMMDCDGNGLGLYINNMIMKSLKGTISFESEEDQGTKFVVRLPRKAARKPSTTKKKTS